MTTLLAPAPRLARHVRPACAITLAAVVATAVSAQTGTVYRCPGNPVNYTDQITAQQAKDRGCKTLDGAPITIVTGPPKSKPVAAATSPAAAAARPADQKVDAREQRERDADARRILEAELRKEEDKLAELKREYNHGEPERQGNEKNYQRYLDRVEGLKQAIARKEADIGAIRRELGKFGVPTSGTNSAKAD